MSEEMGAVYDSFIEDWAYLYGTAGTCREATTAMVLAFPHLRRTVGMIVMKDAPDGDIRPWPHWWCVDVDGTIVDPTRAQFPCAEIEYFPADPEKGTPTGKCMNCGWLAYNKNPFCSEACEKTVE